MKLIYRRTRQATLLSTIAYLSPGRFASHQPAVETTHTAGYTSKHLISLAKQTQESCCATIPKQLLGRGTCSPFEHRLVIERALEVNLDLHTLSKVIEDCLIS